jgi:hypothetical protein
MPLSPDSARTTTAPARRSAWPAVAIAAAGFGLTLLVFYPGVMTYDAKYVYLDIAKGFYGDWQSPVMTLLWKLIDPLAPGPASMFVLIAMLYWLGFGLLAVTLARRSIWSAIALLVLALSPPAFVFVGTIWRDMLLANAWLLAAALAFAVADRDFKLRVPAQVLALCLLALGVLLRPNALIAAPILAAYILWPAQFSCKRAAILFVPAMIAFYLLIQIVYYGALGATRQHPLQTLLVFDLGGISHFTKENQFPGTWTEDDSQRIMNRCYKSSEWDIYWRFDPCRFVMNKLEQEQKLFGTPAVTKAWLSAILNHPIAYLEHRSAFFWHFLSADNLTMWTYNIEEPDKPILDGRPAIVAVMAIDAALKPTPLLRTGTWLLVCIAAGAVAWRRRDRPAGAFALAVGASGAVFALSYFAFGVASDFRYGYWAVLAGLSGAVAALTPRSP